MRQQRKAFVEDNVRRAEAQSVTPTIGGYHCFTLAAPNQPVYYLYSDDRTIMLCDHVGVPLAGGTYQVKLGPKENADDVARDLFYKSRGLPTLAAASFIRGLESPNA